MQEVVLITGGSSGLGKAIGEYLLERGYIVYGTTRTPDKYVGKSMFPLLAMDVKDPDLIREAVDQLIEKEGRVDVLINNAGVGITGPLEETPIDEVHGAFDTNYYGPLRVIQAVLPTMRARGAGRIINVTSIAAFMGLPYRGVYSASKAALQVTTEALRMEVADFGISVSNLAPGDFATNIASGRYHAPLLDGSAYRETYGPTLQTMNQHVDAGGDPAEVARAVYKILNSDRPRIHYKVGAFLQRFSVGIKRVLPDRTFERMLKRHYHIK
jgi:NAD(P)-dependent dehydrogenase (short-subunit alcohol dehydrogenase family)